MDPPQPRPRRGINRIQDLPVGESVEFNQFGLAVGKWQYLYGKYLGTHTRRLISILKKNWKDLTKEEKKFYGPISRLENDDVKKRTLVSCGNKWKAFKTKLRVKFMMKRVSPCMKWTFIQPNVWEEFCQKENTPEKYVHKLRAQASERGKKHISQPRLGPKRYRGFEQQWQEERNDTDKATELHLIPDIRGSNYCLARAPHDKNGIKPLPANLIDVSKNLVQATRELAQASNESKAGVDPLIMVLGPEHGGRTRGVGCDIGYKKGIEGYVRKKRTYEQQKDIEEIRTEVRQQMKEELKSSDFWDEMRAELKIDTFSPRREGNHSSTKSIGRKEQQGEQNESISTRQVNVPSSVQRRSNVSSTTSIIREEHQGEQNDSISTRQVDVLSSVQRRSTLSSTTSMGKLQFIKEETACCLFTPSSVLAGERVACATTRVFPIGDGILHHKKLLNGHMKVSVIKVVDNYKNMGLPVPNDEIPNLKSAINGFIQWPIVAIARFTVKKEKAANRKSLQALEDEILSLYQLKGHSSQNKVGFLNPGVITEDSCFYEKSATIDYLTQSLTGYDFCLAPYLQGRYYVLLIICPKHGRGFVLNPSKGSNKNEQSYRLAGLVESVVGSLKWEFPLVNRQPGFVAKTESLTHGTINLMVWHYTIPGKTGVPWCNERSLDKKELNAVVGAWFNLWRD
ncbi:ulp1 protease family, C-terminal catalytic domain-containing protein [Tanacetum coccineum]|uniref:Ulp1 protease family, C-terminal catalytic domain-containing protein n=1 Tax=Tanacetum coccineum TaxID=301880 RepID=A0ABQ5H2H6_9ASTR